MDPRAQGVGVDPSLLIQGVYFKKILFPAAKQQHVMVAPIVDRTASGHLSTQGVRGINSNEDTTLRQTTLFINKGCFIPQLIKSTHMSQGVENQDSLIGVPLAFRETGNGRNTVSRALFRKRDLTEFYIKLGELCEKLGEFALVYKS